MYLFSRLATLRGSERASTAWAIETCEYVDAHSDHDVTLWRSTFGYPVGTVAWTTWVESLEALSAGFAALVADDGYHDQVERGAEFVTGAPQDLLRRVIHGDRGDAAPPIGAVVTMTTATMANGRYVEATAWGADTASFVEKITHMPTFFMLDEYGTFGQVTWFSGAPDLPSADAAAQIIDADHDYVERLTEAAELFLPGSGRRGMLTRIA